MRVLLDTNVLLRLSQPDNPHSTPAEKAIQSLRMSGRILCVVPQSLYEFWAVATRPQSANGLGMATDEVREHVRLIKRLYTFLNDDTSLFANWESLVQKYCAVGKSAHDARLVAAMFAHGIAQLLTFNDTDFARYDGIVVRSPFELASTPGTP